METAKLKKFAQFARRSLMEQVSAKLALVLAENSSASRENVKAVQSLENEIKKYGKEQVVEKVAYIWFNRFCALRFMDVNRYTRIGVVTPAEGQFQPEILAEAKMGHIDEDMMPDKTRQHIFDLLSGKRPSHDAQGEAYRLLVVAICNFWNKAMPFLFQRINDYTELLMPDDLLSGNSVLAYTREAMTPAACEDVEVIGWLYQYYISEKKDEVFEGLKKNKKITPENIPAATQLFTPHWIVRYLVENSLGRLWMLNHPKSRLIEQMAYYIKPEQAETDFLHINKPEELKICDPACGSGHMLTYAFDLLYAIYEEEGYETTEIPEKILTHNLYGIEIDERAGELAAFALTMKARARQRRFFISNIMPNICVLENIILSSDTIDSYKKTFGNELFTTDVVNTLKQFEEANNFGSLIIPHAKNLQHTLNTFYNLQERANAKIGSTEKLSQSEEVLVRAVNFAKILQALEQADYLSPKYHVVIANPPYMGRNGMNDRLAAWAKDNYPKSKSDMFAMFIERNIELAQRSGMVAMITMQSWMFLSSFEALRTRIIEQSTILSMTHLGARAFDSIGGEVVATTAFVIANSSHAEYKGDYVRLIDGKSEAEKSINFLEATQNPQCGWLFHASAADFKKIPGSPIAYWVSKAELDAYQNGIQLKKYTDPRQGFATGNNNRFLRIWGEVNFDKIDFCGKNGESTSNKWFPCNKGGGFRRWYGNNSHVVNWENGGREMKSFEGSVIRNPGYYFLRGMTWSTISSFKLSMRYSPEGFLFETKGSVCFPIENASLFYAMGFANSKVTGRLLLTLSPTLDFHEGPIGQLPVIFTHQDIVENIVNRSVAFLKNDWDSYETSWDFTNLPLLSPDCRQLTLEATYIQLRAHGKKMTLEMQKLEEENNLIFIDAYGLQDELTPEVPLDEITLTCNPHYRYGGNKSEAKLDALLLADTMREFISYAVGCMFGRYALEKPGLILANQGETFADFRQQIPASSFPADEDNVIPILDGDWFADDISERFRKFLRVTFGDEHYEENLSFIEQALNVKGKQNYSIKDYFLGEFYNDHIKRYKKRPIYWLFSSPKGSFNALIYMHRYRPDTVSIVLNDYLREFRTKLTAHKNHLEALSISTSASQGDKTKALKELEKVKTMLHEMEEYERDVLYPLATQKVEIDLDDGVKVNYLKFGKALKKIPGLEAKEA